MASVELQQLISDSCNIIDKDFPHIFRIKSESLEAIPDFILTERALMRAKLRDFDMLFRLFK